MEQIVIYLLMVQKFINLKRKFWNCSKSIICLGNISKDWPTDNLKKTGFNGYVYDFSVDYYFTDTDDIQYIHKYLMKKITM